MPTQEEIVQALGDMSVLQIIELTKTLEDKWGVKAAPVPMLGIAPPPGTTITPVVEEQTEFSVVLVAAGEKKIEVIKAVRAAIGLGLAEAKAFVEAGLPRPVKEGLNKAAAEELKGQLEAAGAKVELK